MWSDPVVDETRRAREEVVAPFGGNIHAFFEYIRERERQSAEHVVTLEPNAPEQLTQNIASR